MAKQPTATRTKRASSTATKEKPPAKPPKEEPSQADRVAAAIPENVGRASRAPRSRKTVKPREITEEMEPFIERRLELPAGTTPVEVAADLCNRFGIPWAKDGPVRNDRKQAIAEFRKACGQLDRIACTSTMHRNTAARRKSRLSRRLRELKSRLATG